MKRKTISTKLRYSKQLKDASSVSDSDVIFSNPVIFSPKEKHKVSFAQGCKLEDGTKSQEYKIIRVQKKIIKYGGEASARLITRSMVKDYSDSDKDAFEQGFDLSKFLFADPKDTQRFLAYTEYVPVIAALDKNRYDVVQYYINNNTNYGKFKILSYDNYKIVGLLIKSLLNTIEDKSYDSKTSQDMLKLIFTVNHLYAKEALCKISRGGLSDKMMYIYRDLQKIANDEEFQTELKQKELEQIFHKEPEISSDEDTEDTLSASESDDDLPDEDSLKTLEFSTYESSDEEISSIKSNSDKGLSEEHSIEVYNNLISENSDKDANLSDDESGYDSSEGDCTEELESCSNYNSDDSDFSKEESVREDSNQIKKENNIFSEKRIEDIIQPSSQNPALECTHIGLETSVIAGNRSEALDVNCTNFSGQDLNCIGIDSLNYD